jgi:osmoprotectant transport system substrate-binding protein
VGLLFSTDPAIRDDDLVVLRDDRRLQPSENVTPLVRADVVGRWGPGVVAALDGVSGGLTTTELRAMNARVAAGAEPAAVAVAWLRAEGLA